MKKHAIVLSLVMLASLAACSKANISSSPSSSSSSSGTATSSPIASSDTASSSASSSSTILPPSFDKDDFSYLIGDYYATNSKLTISEKNLVLKADEELKLTPTNVEKVTITYEEEEKEKSYDTLKIEFSSQFNDMDYQAYVNFQDGLLHLESLDSEEKPTTIGTYMPSISEFSGSYSAYGDSSTYNMYVLFSGEFDEKRGVFPSSHKYSSSISNEQSWYIKSNFVQVDDKVYKQIEEFDEDAYGYGKNIIYKDTAKEKIYVFSGTHFDDDYVEYMSDIGSLQNLSLFDGEKEIILNIDIEEKTITFGTLSGTYATKLDGDGLKVEATMDKKTYTFSFGERYLIVHHDNKDDLYPFNAIDDLYGSYSDGTNSFVIEETFDQTDPKVTFNEEVVTYKFVIANKRKSIQFTKNGKTYTLSPDKKDAAIRLEVDQTVSYPINITKFKAYYTDTFIAHEKNGNKALKVNDDLSFVYQEEYGTGSLAYDHGDKYPTLLLTTSSNKAYSLNLAQANIGYYILLDGVNMTTLYSETALESAYGEYSSDGENSFVFDAYHLTIDGKTTNYTFAPSYDEDSGLFLFGIQNEKKETYVSNLSGTFISENNVSYVKKNLFKEIAGTYQAYGKYGIENIEFTNEGELYLDIVNQAGTGLEKHVKFTYTIYTNYENKAVIIFSHRNVYLTITFKDNHVTIANLDYYNSNLVRAWGTYSDEGKTKTLYVQDDMIYIDGESLSIDSIEYDDEKTIYHTSDYTITYYSSSDNFTLDSASSSLKLERKLSYTDLDKFVGTYTINNSEVKVEKNSIMGYDVTISGFPLFSPYSITTHNGKLSLTFSDSSGKYFLMLDESTNEITTDFEGSSIPVPPPLPTHF